VAYRRLPLAEGFVEYVVDGPEDARDLLIFHSGTPNAATHWDGLIAAAAHAGLRTTVYSRGGYGTSPRREGRTIAGEAAITAALADRLGAERFFVLGTSGGGPPALAAAALLADRVLACGVAAGLAPRVEAGPAWDAFVPEQQRAEWDALAADDIGPLLDDFRQSIDIFGGMTATKLRSIGGQPDARAVRYDHRHQFIPALVRSMRRAVSHGFYGYLDDNIAQARDWGFRVADIRVPVVVRHGALDRLVNMEHGRWLAANIPGARGTFLDDAGHGSICLPWSEVVTELVEAARSV
jgi:pimeloyl-ACP methyl ester carboxylesterase